MTDDKWKGSVTQHLSLSEAASIKGSECENDGWQIVLSKTIFNWNN